MPDYRLVLAARAMAKTAAGLRDGAALSGDPWTEALKRGEAVTDTAEDADDNPGAFAEAVIDYLWHLAREGEPEVLARTMVVALPATGEDARMDAAWQSAVIGALGIVTLRRTYPSRQDATKAREEYAGHAEPVLEAVGHQLGPDAYTWLTDLVGLSVRILSRIAADRAPLVRVESGISMPSTRLAYDLYQDPSRAVELVDRNKVATPCLMPVAFEALAS